MQKSPTGLFCIRAPITPCVYNARMTQEEALEILKSGANVFLTGEPGAGKTHTLNAYITYLREHSMDVAITASTGIAATHIGGMTIHAWSGIGIKDSLTPYDLEQITTRERVAKRIMSAKVIVIDEISMLDARVFGMVDQVLRVVKRSELPFGGIQVVLVGDFFQLPPIGKGGDIQFAYDAPAWKELDLLICYLTEQHRQDDSSLASLLASLRSGTVDESCYDVLQSCSETTFAEGIEPTRLYTHNADVDRINAERLASLEGEARTYTMEGKGARQIIEGLKKSCLSPEALSLKIGAMVMCTKNNFDAGYVNGTLGQVVGYDVDTGYPIITKLDGVSVTVAPASWSVSEGDAVLAEVTQVPLRLAWAITVHKSQGMSLDAAEMDLSRAFEYGQGYVALSRVRSLSGLLLRGCNERALEVHPSVRAHDEIFQERSDSAQTAFAEMSPEDTKQMHEQFIRASGGTLERKEISKTAPKNADQTSTYEKTRLLIADGKSIEETARARGVSHATICAHLEYLAPLRMLKPEEVAHLAPQSPEEKKQYRAVADAMKVVGGEKLKPIHEHLKGSYSYDVIRAMRAIHGVLGDLKE